MASDESIDDLLARLGEARGVDSRLRRGKDGLKARLFGNLAVLGEDRAPSDTKTRSVESEPEPEELEGEGEGDRGRSPERIGPFLVLGPLGQGGMGKVYRAYDPRLGREVAIKVVRPGVGRRHVRRLLREAQALARLSHPNVVQIYEVGELHDQLVIAMELVPGQTLRQWQRREPRPGWKDCLDIYLQAGRGLAAAHAKGLVHRDFKPSNCIVDEEGRVRVLDFGLVRTVDAAGESDDEAPEPGRPVESGPHDGVPVRLIDPGGSSNALMERLTETGSVLGTWAYMAPEQLREEQRATGPKGDQFAFCVALYEALCGRLPFSDDPREALRAMASGTSRPPLPMPAGSRVPRWLQRAIVRGLAGDPGARWPSMASLLRVLEHGRRGVGVRRWALAGAGLVLLALGGMALWREPPCADAAEPLRGVWDEPRRQAVGDAILATGLPYAEQTQQTVQRQLDDYAERWVQGNRAACQATRVHHEQSPEELELRTQCLWRRRAALEYDVELLTEADAERVERAVELVAGLPPVEPCADVSALTKASGTSRTPQQRAALEELEGSLERVRAKSALGRYEEALAVIEPLLTRIRARAHEPVLLAEAQVLRGQLFQELSRHRDAEREFQQAQALALEHGADGAALEAMAGQIYLAGVVRDQTELALRLSTDTAQPLVRRVAPGGAVAAMILTATAQVLTMRGEHAQAESSYREALEILGATRGEDIVLADTLDGLAQVMRTQGKVREAVDLSRRAFEIHKVQLGEDHPRTAYQRVNLGVALIDLGEVAEGEQHCLRTLEILEAAPKVDHRSIAHTRATLATALYSQGEHALAEQQLRKALALRGDRGSDQLLAAKLRMNLAMVLKAQGRPEDAIGVYRTALEGLGSDESTPERTLVTARILSDLSTLLDRQGRAEEAAEHLGRAIAIVEHIDAQSDRIRDPMIISVFNRHGDLLRKQGDHAGAERSYRRALEAYQSFDDPTYGTKIAVTLERLADLYCDRQQWRAALEHLERAQTTLLAAGAASKPERLEALEQRLGEVRAHLDPE